MNKIILALVLVMLSAPALAKKPLTCWYNAEGEFKGADTGSHGVPESDFGMLVKSPENHGVDYELSLVLTEWDNGNSCPETVDIQTIGMMPE